MARVYRNIATPILFFGLELVDCLLVFGIFLGVFYVSDHLFINLLIVGGSYLFLRLLKRGKPAGYTIHLLKFLLSLEESHVQIEARHHEPR